MQERIFANVSKAIAAVIKNEMAISEPEETTDIETVRARIVEKAQNLVLHLKPPGKKSELSQEYLNLKAKLKQLLERGPLARFSFEELENLFFMLAQVARYEGILMLENEGFLAQVQPVAGAEEELFHLGLSLILNGAEPRLVEATLNTRAQALLHHLSTRYQMIAEGLTAIRAGSYPGFIDLNLRNFYISVRQGDGEYTENPVAALKEKLQEKPFAHFTLDEVTQFVLDLSVAVRKEGPSILADLAEQVDDELLGWGLEAMQMLEGNIEPKLVQRLIEIQARTLQYRHDTRYQMISEGLRSIQNGENPRIIAQKLKCFYA